MFDSLSERLAGTIKRLRGQARLTEDNIKESLRDVRMALLEADVALPVVRQFIEAVKTRAVGQEVLSSLTPGQVLVKIVHEELVQLMGTTNAALDLSVQPPAVVLVVGLQGSGKTTSVAKLARWLSEREHKDVMVVSADVYRPAAIQQLATLAEEVGVHYCPSDAGQEPRVIVTDAVAAARQAFVDVLLVDTAGRLHVDEAMMDEVRALHEAVNPVETLFVVDSMTGQDAANTAKAFHDALPLTGVVLTKTDGDARGGAALSVRQITGCPIKFLGIGEKTEALEPFYPDRVASRILGMGDVLSLVEEIERKVDKEQAAKLTKKLKKGQRFDLEDLRQQLRQVNKLGGIAGMMEKMPAMPTGMDPTAIQGQGEKEMRRMLAIIDSMTRQERRHPDIIKASRKRRIALGSGTQVQDVNRMLKQFLMMRKQMKSLSKGGMMKMMQQMQQMQSGTPRPRR